jgi:hypothetical protein
MAEPKPDEVVLTEVAFQSPKGGPAATVTVSGAADLHRSPEKILKLMDVLSLPKGTKATVTVKVSSVITR